MKHSPSLSFLRHTHRWTSIFWRFAFSAATLLFLCAEARTQVNENPEALFLNPPINVRPYVWWHWMGSNFSRPGITRDLEAMKAAGIGGATIFNISSAVQESHAPTLNNPWPHQSYRGLEYWEAIRFAAAEADRLGLEIGLHNTVGYSTTGGPWIDEERSMQHLVWSDTTIQGETAELIILNAPKLIADEGWGATGRTLSFYKDIAVLAVPAKKNLITETEILDLTSSYNPGKGLRWKSRPGAWTVYRIGHASTGRPPHPVPDDVIGKTLEADKMSAEQSIYHWNTVLKPVKEHLSKFLGKSFKHMLIDSYEAGYQNWTPRFQEEFRKRKGYDPLPWILTMGQPITGDQNTKPVRIIGSAEETKRFEWDYYDVINQLFFENGFRIGKQMLADHQLSLQFEPYGGPFNTAEGVALADLPMGEFWTWSKGEIDPAIPAAARAMGKRIVGAEAFTGWPTNSMYTEDPAFLKKSADGSYASGVNRLVLHHWVHQPFDDRYQPGMGMGWWGTHFGRHQTWFEPGKAFLKYLGRCQVLLQHGEQVADYLCVEKSVGFSDLISKNDFLSMKIIVDRGMIRLPSGRRYPFMVFSDSLMLPEVARKIKALVASGAAIVSRKPAASPSLKDYPRCDAELKSIADEIWGNGRSGRYKKGLLFTRIEDAIRTFNRSPDYQVEKAASQNAIRIVHRRSSAMDSYFIANTSDTAQHLSLSFRCSGKQPELWQAEDGSITDAPVWNDHGGRTTVELLLKGTQSVFVVFRKPALPGDHPVSIAMSDSVIDWSISRNRSGQLVMTSDSQKKATVVFASGKTTIIGLPSPNISEVTGNWRVSFAPKMDTPFSLELSALVDFSKHNSKRVQYFSGTATYRNSFSIDSVFLQERRSVVLDLGELHDIAALTINGKAFGVLWYPPFAADVTDLLKPGENSLEISVTNNWANRLIGDEQEPADFEWGKDRGESMGRAMLAYPDWFINNQPRPSSGRKAFSIWYYYRADSKLQPAGLIGPVRLIDRNEMPVVQ